MATAQTFIEAAYNRSASNDPGKLAQDAELIAHLNRVYQRFYALFAKARPDEASSRTTWVLVGNPGAHAIAPDTIAIVDVRTAAGKPVHLIPAHETGRAWHVAPSMYRIGNTIYSRAQGGDPIGSDAVTVVLLDAPVTITSLGTSIDVRFPTRHHQLCIDALALYLDTKDDGRDPAEHAKLVTEYGTALASFASEYDLAPSSLEWAHARAQRSAGVGASPA